MEYTGKTRGLRHLALRVRDVLTSQAFYERHFDMKVVWKPDPDNVYLSTGVDNLALHQVPKEEFEKFATSPHHPLDHLGFLMDSREKVEALFAEVSAEGVTIVHPPKLHRDASFSFYLADPDSNTIQVLFEPRVQL
ncbi:MAG: VOC family protein [Nitrospirota bacterium]|nr:VOC family protein [Nitrospirota bacterium]